MEILTARSAGFCFGVKRAVSKVYELMQDGTKTATYGPIVHNESVISDLSEHGVYSIEEIPEEPEGLSVVIRAHGVPEKTEKALQTSGAKVIDMTCPFVKKIHMIVREHSEAGEQIVIVGDPKHPEVVGIRGWAVSDTYVVNSPEEAETLCLEKDRKVCIVSQTTNNVEKFEKIVEKIVEKNCIASYNCIIVNTICNATKERQAEAAEIAEKADVMIVIGGRNSSNSQKLYSICENICNHTYFIQTADDLKSAWFRHIKCVGITAGASTPERIIEEVQTYVRKF